MQIVEPHLRLVPSVLWRGYRVRCVWGSVFFRPPAETFHEFVRLVLQLTLGDEWWEKQQSLPQGKKHVVIKWFDTVRQWLAANKTDEHKVKDGLWMVKVSGYAQSLLQLGYDVLCLQQVNRLPTSLTERLRGMQEFQGARYEVGVAAMFARAGFLIEWCEEVHGKKICEFIARHTSGLTVAVEAKSRRRPGVLNEKGEPAGEFRADLKKLYGKARKKKPNFPFVIFLDANLPPTPEIPWEESPWLPEIKAMFDQFPLPTPEEPDAHNMVVITNYGFYYHGDGPSKTQPALYIESQHPKYPFTDRAAWNALQESIERYTVIPDEA